MNLPFQVLSRVSPVRDPNDVDRYLVRCQSKIAGRKTVFWVERNDADCDRETTIRNIMSGEIDDVIQVVCFNSHDHTCDDVSEDIARDVAGRYASEYGCQPPDDLLTFLEEQIGVFCMKDLPEREAVP